MSAFPCPKCGKDTRYQSMSGGREFYCPQCGYTGTYPQEAEGLPRAALLRTQEGTQALREQMREELDRRYGPGQVVKLPKNEEGVW